MELVVKHFKELTTEELFDIYKLRSDVFIIEQNCACPDVDDADKVAYHVYFKRENGILAYLRVLPQGIKFDEVSIGRVIAVKRRCGLGSKILSEGIRVAKEKFDADAICIEAQVYVKSLYEKMGFVQVSDEFLEDGIPHIKMILKLSK